MKYQKALIYAKVSNFTFYLLFFLEKPLDQSILANPQAIFFSHFSHYSEKEKKKKSWRTFLEEKITVRKVSFWKKTQKEPIFFATT